MTTKGKPSDATLRHKAPVWTVIYDTSGGCYHVEIGKYNAQPISYEVVKRLADKFFKENKEKQRLRSIPTGCASAGCHGGLSVSSRCYRQRA